MFFQQKFSSVFLLFVMHLKLNSSLNVQRINKTLFVFNNPTNCKRSEYYNVDYFSCFPCDLKANLQPIISKFVCGCTPNSKTIAFYDSSLRRPICTDQCQNTKTKKCRNVTTTISPLCNFKFINTTSEQTDKNKHIRMLPLNPLNKCSCDSNYNYLHGDICIWKDLLNYFLNYNAYWHRGEVFRDLKFVAFFCQSLHNITACNHLANLCVQSFFDIDKNSPCRVFLLAQSSDAPLFLSDELRDLRPFLFYKRGKDTVLEMEEKINNPSAESLDNRLELFTAVYSLKGQLVQWGRLLPNHVNLCGQNFDGPYGHFQYFRRMQIVCDLKIETVIDLASLYANHRFFTVFLNHTKADNIRYMQTVPILIENAFDGNMELNVGEWQLVKRFQLIAASPSMDPVSTHTPVYDEYYKLKRFKSIRMLRKFELRCTVTQDNKISLPLIVLSYHQIDISPNTSLNEAFKFELLVEFKRDESSKMLYKIGLPILFIISLVVAIFKSYIFKCRRNSEWCDMIIGFSFSMHFISNIGSSFLIIVLIDIFNSILIFTIQPNENRMPSLRNLLFEILIYSAVFLKGFHFSVRYWKIAHIDIFFVDWERPKGYDASLNLKNYLETSSQCSSIRTYTENNVSAWRTFFIANEWIELGPKQKISPFLQGLASLTLYWIISSIYPAVCLDAAKSLFMCIMIFSFVHILQRIFWRLIINQLLGNPLQKFIDICTMANLSIFTLLDSSFGYYIHGRSPHGFSDTDMPSMILQLQRESQNMCAKRGLLSDSDFQAYIILPPLNLRSQIEKLLALSTKSENLPQIHFHKGLSSIGNHFEGTLDKTTIAYNRVNRFLCAFIDHAIKDMDYIIKEKTFIESLLDCEFKNFLTDNKGTFYIDNGLTFSNLFLSGNQNDIFVMELLLLIAVNLLTSSYVTSIVVVCVFNKIFFYIWTRNNIATKTLIDKRFLM